MRQLTPVILAVAVALLLPGSTLGATCKAPPGLSGLDQYCETVPSGGGDAGAGGNGGGGGGPRIAPAERRRLARSGAAGRQLLAFARSSSGRSHAPNGHRRGKHASGRSAVPAAEDASAAGRNAAAAGAEQGGGLGFLWWLLAAMALAGAAAAWLRRRRGTVE